MKKITKLFLFTIPFLIAGCTNNPSSTTEEINDTTSEDSSVSSGSFILPTSTSSELPSTSSGDDSSTIVVDPNGKVQITINYNDGKTANKVITINYGSAYGVNFVFPTRVNYTFKGWFAQLSGGVEKQITAEHNVVIEYHHTVKACWEVYSGPGVPTYDMTYNFENPNAYKTGEYLTNTEYIEGSKTSLLFNSCLITNSTSSRDNRDGSHSIRIKENGHLSTYVKVDGLSQISFKHAPYKPTNPSTTVQSTIYLEYSIDAVVWTSLDTFTTSNSGTSGFSSYSKQEIGIGFMIYIRLRNGIKSSDTQINIDLFRIMGRK